MDTSAKIIGIDLGTTNSVVAVVEGDDPVVIPNQEGANKTPSVVAFLDNNDCIVGEIARRQAATNPQRTVSSVKRLMGRPFEDIEEASARFPFDLVNHDERLLIDINGYGFSPEQISALILRKLKESAEAYLGEQVRQAVITVPAHFDDNQRNATIEAARLAGLDVLRLINEPTAAALAYGLGKGKESEEIVAVFDFGGGTFDISIMEIAGKTFEVLTSTGDSNLGGDDLDNVLVSLIVEEFRDQHNVDLAEDPVTLRRLKEVAEKAKCELSTASQTQITLPFIAYRDGTPLHLERSISRSEFEELIDSFVNRTIRCCKRALEDAGISKKDIDKVILVGGSTRIPMVQDAVEDFFGLQPFKGINPDEVVALGAAAQAGIFSGNIEEVTLLDVAPHSLGIEVKDGKFSRIIEKNATIPIKAAKNFTTTEDNQSFVVIHILQGEEDVAADNRSLGKFILSDIPAQPRGRARIRVTFFVNADGVMEISAEELGSGIAKTLTIVHSELDENERSARKRARKRGGGKKEPSRERRGDPEKNTKRYAADTAGGAMDLRGRPPQGGTSARRDGTPQPQPMPPSTPRQGFEVMGDTRPGSSPTTHVVHRASAEAVALPSRDEIPQQPAAKAPAVPAAPAAPQRPAAPPAPPAAAAPLAPKPAAPAPAPQVPDVERPSSAFPNPPRYTRPEPPRPANMASPIIDPPTTVAPTRNRIPALQEDETHDKPAHQPAALNPFTPPPPAPIIDPPTTIVPMEEIGSAIDSIAWPAGVEAALQRAQAADQNGDALEQYQRALAALDRPPHANDGRFGAQLGRFWLQLGLGQAEVLREALTPVIDQYALTNGRDLLLLLDKAVETSANPEAFRRHRSRLRELLGDLEGACEDYEGAAKAEPEEGDAQRLENLYRARMARGDDPAAQFKLVRLFLKAERVDEAIDILQKLQHNEQYETRALKILGLCHWQKNLHFLAWQKFKQLRQTDEIREILYRLGADMEGTGQLANALQVYEHLMGESPDYKDVQSKVKKLRYRIKMQQEESEQGKAQSVLTDPRFTIIEEINRGSMGIIYKARDKTLDEVVALKVLNDYLCTDPSAVERFKREARAAKKLAHPYIVRIHDMFESGSKRFISMEYIEGTDLKRMLADHVHFNEDQLVFYFLQICDAMAYAHKLNIIHRDIKPANVMITKANTVKVTDFGIAKILKGDDSTKSGTAVIGTPLYMAPEQITGEGVDARSDIYSLGIMMYELSSGQPPFYLGNIEYHHIHTPPPALPASVSEKVKRIILKCVEKQPINRYQSVDEIYEDLRRD